MGMNTTNVIRSISGRRGRGTLLLVLAGVLSCAPQVPVSTTSSPAATAAERPFPRDVLWARTSAEHRAIFVQTFRAATERLAAEARGRPSGSWAVVADADETLIDNSEYQRRLHLRGARFDSLTWDGWVREEAATALPGALEYVRAVKALGGRFVVVTNREHDVCPQTERNIRALGMEVDLVLCRRGVSDKNPRFESVAAGTAGGGLPPLEVLQYIGDNIQDFPRFNQRLRDEPEAAYAMFGERYFVLPNPMYGSFERNAPR
jgi:5'-nucleotidase (lipoprotein e(P4) family)